jgi:sortase (surface protein transpeptidase)
VPVAGPLLSRSAPVRLEIPQINVRSDLLQLGLNADQTVQVPPLSRDSEAGWYKYSPTPGQLGPSVILGHVDSAKYGPGVFFKLGALRPGDTLSVTRSDHITAVFRVDRVVSYPKDRFPTLEVYGNTDSAQLRLITCGGKFDLSSHNYQDNIVAFATLVSSHPA